VYTAIELFTMPAYTVLTVPAVLDIASLHASLVRLYACESPTAGAFATAVANSIPFAAVAGDGSIAGFVRVVSDRATFAILRDAFVAEAHRGKGVSRLLIEAVAADPRLAGVPLTFPANSARGFYEHCGLAAAELDAPLKQLVRPL
jgi:GNAT superfamily N-acetyltransferase